MNYLEIFEDFKKDYGKDKSFFENKIKPISRILIIVGIIGIILTYFSPFLSGIFFLGLLFPISYIRTNIIETNLRRKKWLNKLNFTNATIQLNKEINSKLNKTMFLALIFGLALIFALALFLFFIKGLDGMFIELGNVFSGVTKEIPDPLLIISYFTAFIVGFITLGIVNNIHNECYKFQKETKTIIQDIKRNKKELKKAGLI